MQPIAARRIAGVAKRLIARARINTSSIDITRAHPSRNLD
jgi:hypothetical protein